MLRKVSAKCYVHFFHIRSHDNNFFNHVVDVQAKSALRIEGDDDEKRDIDENAYEMLLSKGAVVGAIVTGFVNMPQA